MRGEEMTGCEDCGAKAEYASFLFGAAQCLDCLKHGCDTCGCRICTHFYQIEDMYEWDHYMVCSGCLEKLGKDRFQSRRIPE